MSLVVIEILHEYEVVRVPANRVLSVSPWGQVLVVVDRTPLTCLSLDSHKEKLRAEARQNLIGSHRAGLEGFFNALAMLSFPMTDINYLGGSKWETK